MLYITENHCLSSPFQHRCYWTAPAIVPAAFYRLKGFYCSFIIVWCLCSLWGKCSQPASSLLVKNTVVQFFMVWLIPTSRYTAFMMKRAKLYPLLVEWHFLAFNNNGFMKLCSQFFRFPKRKLSHLRELLREFILQDLQVSRSKGAF